MEKKLFYSAESAHGSESSHGFANDTIVYAWDSKKSRDNYITHCRNISAQAVKRVDVTKHATNWSMTNNCEIKPRPFYPEFWGIVSLDDEYKCQGTIKHCGLVGEIRICDECTYNLIRRFYA